MAAMFRTAFLLTLLAAPAVAKTPAVHVSGWARATMPAQKNSAAYLSLHNAGAAPDRLLSVSTPAAPSATVHSTSMAGGVMRMRAAAGVTIAAGKAVTMKPGGLHIMLTGLRAPLRAGQRLPLTLRFQRAGVVRTSLPIKASEPKVGHGH